MRGLLWNWRTMVGALVEALDWPETVVTGIGITALIMLILFLIGRWGIFRKFGEAGWKSLIPYYSQWVEYGYTWNPKIILWNVAAAIVNYIGDVSIIALKKGPILTVAMIGIILFWICRFAVSQSPRISSPGHSRMAWAIRSDCCCSPACSSSYWAAAPAATTGRRDAGRKSRNRIGFGIFDPLNEAGNHGPLRRPSWAAFFF